MGTRSSAHVWQKDRPTLGICIGMQILFETGLEPSRPVEVVPLELDIWPGSISKLTAPILPHMGWNTVKPDEGSMLFTGVLKINLFILFIHMPQQRVWVRCKPGRSMDRDF